MNCKIPFHFAWSIILLLATSVSLHAQNVEFNEYQPEQISSMQAIDRGDQLVWGDSLIGPGIGGPVGPQFTSDGSLVFWELLEDRFTITDMNLRTIRTIPAVYDDPQYLPGLLSLLPEGRFALYFSPSNEQISVFGPDGNLESYVFLRSPVLDTSVYINDTYFAWDRWRNIYSVVDPGPDNEENNRNVLGTAATRALFAPGSTYETNGLSIDDANRLFLNGELVVRDYETFLDYWIEVHSEQGIEQPDIGISMNAETFRHGSPQYVGRDNDGNYYWGGGTTGIVFDENGLLIDVFAVHQVLGRDFSSFVHPTGDIYFFGSKVESSGRDLSQGGALDMHPPQVDSVTFSLYRMERRW